MFVVLGLAGCASQRSVAETTTAPMRHYVLLLRDRLENTVADGQIDLPVPTPTIDGSFSGGWHLTSATDFGPTIRRSGTYTGMLAAGLYSFNLSPDVPDDSVHLSGLLLDGSIQGRWTHESNQGEREMGQFVIRPLIQPQ
jgi:hypothetical protein